MFRFMFQIMVQFLVRAFGVDVLSSNSLLRMIFSHFLKVHVTSLIHVIIVMFYLLFSWIKFYGKLLIFPTSCSAQSLKKCSYTQKYQETPLISKILIIKSYQRC
jgi:hypothetical protein